MRNLFRLKITERGTEVFNGHAVADSPFSALTTIDGVIEAGEGALSIEVEMVGEVAVMPEKAVKPGLPGKPGVSTSKEPA